MAQEAPPNPNTGGTGAQSSNYSEVRSPQFVGGSIDPTTGNIDQSSASQAAVAPPAPATPTTQLASLSAPKTPSAAATFGGMAAETALPYVGAKLGSSLGGGASVSDAISGLTAPITSGLKSIGTTLGGTTAPVADAAFGGVSTPISYLGAGGVTDLTAAPATSTAATAVSDSLGSTLDGAAGYGIGAGIGTAVSGALSGEQPKQYLVPAAESAGGGALGFAIGEAVLPGIGGFIGGAIGSLFCHIAGTLVRMEDGTLKPVETIKLHDRLFLGGNVIGCGVVMVTNLFSYRGTVVNGQHAVLEDGRWLRVKDSPIAVPVDVPKCALAYPIATEHHLMVLETHIAADVAEADEDTGAIGRLAELNAKEERNRRLAEVERRLSEKLSVDDLAKMQAHVLGDDGGHLRSGRRNNNIFPMNVLAEAAAAAAVGLPGSRRQQEQIR
jgi:hypothetical protein